MKVEPVRGPKFAAIVRKYGGSPQSFETPVLAGCDPTDPLALLLSNYLLWESTPALAAEALARIARVVVDVNDLRVMLEREVVETIGEKYPFVAERAQRLRSTLNDIFRRQHRTSLDHLRNASRKDQRGYLEGLAEIPPFVSGRTMLVAFELPAAIADDTTVEVLHQNGAVEPTATTADVVAWVAKTHRQEELPKVHHALCQLVAEAWGAAGRNPARIREAYLARHRGFREAEAAAARRIEEERLAKVREAERQAEEKRQAEIAREQERARLKRDAEEAKLRERAEREAARVAAVAARERAKAEREAERIAKEKQRERDAIARAKAAEAKRIRQEAAARKAAIAREKRERKLAALRLKKERAEEARRRKIAQKLAARERKAKAAAKAAAKKATKKAAKKSATKSATKSPKRSSKKPATKSRAATRGSGRPQATKRPLPPKSAGARKSGALKSGALRSGKPGRR